MAAAFLHVSGTARKEGKAMRTEKGFTLIELMIVVGVIAIIASIAIPNLLRSRMSANEAAAIGALRTISNTESQFQAGGYADADGDNVGDYAPLGPAGVVGTLADPSPGAEPFVDNVLGSGFKSGYRFVVTPVDPGVGDETYIATADPLTQGRTGLRRFFMDNTGVIRFTADGTAPGPNSSAVW
jgi:prepilin-type N-terminal cleavage/methylation domain-containing protein